jgi:predicted nucleic acid-binding protein
MNVARVFFDTNILLYLLSEDATKANRAEGLIASGGIVSVQVLNEFAAVATRKLALKFGEIREILTAVRGVCTVIPVDVETNELGLELAERYHFSIYESFIVAAALRAGCKVLDTEDLHHDLTIRQMAIRNPFIA